MYSTAYSYSSKNTHLVHRKDYGQHDKNEETLSRTLAGQQKEPECLVWGSLALVLHICRWFGLAPLQLTPAPNGWKICVSKPFIVYGCCLTFVLHVITVISLYFDFTAGEDNEVKLKSETSKVAILLEVLLAFLMTTLATLTAPGRMRDMIAYMNLINEVHIKLRKGRHWQPGERKKIYSVILTVAAVIILHATDWYSFYKETIEEGENSEKAVYCYIALYVEICMVFLIELQFVFVGLLVESGFKYINRTMRDLIYTYDFEVRFKAYKLISGICETTVPVPVKTDSWREENENENKGVLHHRQRSEIRDTIMSIRSAFITTSDVLKQVNASFGKILLIMLGSFILNLVLTPYYYFSFLVSPRFKILNLVIQGVFMVWYTFIMVLAMEPGHRVETQIRETQVLLGHFFRRLDVQDPLTLDLQNLYKAVTMYQPPFSPLSLTVMTRPIILSIFGAVTTYIVILLQFQSLDTEV